jgi:signal transduction histidine kinase
MKSPRRLLFLLLACFAPILGVQVYAHVHAQQERAAALDSRALNRAELVNSDLSSIVEGVRRLAAAAAQLPSVAAAAPDCARRLGTIQQGTPSIRFLATFDSSGRLLCASDAARIGRAPDWAAALLHSGEPPAGSYHRLASETGGSLPLGVRLGSSPDRPVALAVAGLDLDWLNRHFAQLHLNTDAELHGAALYIADRDGTVLVRTPAGAESAGQKLPMQLLTAVRNAGTGVFHLPDPNGTRIVATVPATVEPAGLAVIETLVPAAPLAGLARGGWLELAVTLGCLLLTLAAVWASARRHPPAALQAPAAAAGPIEAAAVAQQERVAILQAQLTQRDRTVSASNNRLQVEIADRHKAEAALRRVQKLQVVGRLTAGIAHDFNNMLATMLGNLELMERRVEQAAPRLGETEVGRLRSLVARATGAVQRGAQLTSQLLAFARRQQGAPRPTDLNQLIAELAALVASALGRRIRVETQLGERLWPVAVDRSQMEAAILNCCLNARDAMPEGGQLTIATGNRTIARGGAPGDLPPGDYVELRIGDTGAGMTPDVLQRAFEPLFTTKETGGTGLGLTQVLAMAERAGGLARLDSKPGEGTTVILLLPRAAADTGDAPEGPAEERTDLAPCLVLAVDDDIAVRQVTVDMLKEMGCEVLQADGGPEALALLDHTSRWPDVVLLDYAMPGMNGVQLARALRQRGVGVPMALVTGYAELADRENEGNLLDGLLRKPFTIRELGTLLRRLRNGPRQSNVVPLRMPGAA